MAIKSPNVDRVECECGNDALVETLHTQTNGCRETMAIDADTIERLFWCCACGAAHAVVETKNVDGPGWSVRWERREWNEREKRFSPVPA